MSPSPTSFHPESPDYSSDRLIIRLTLSHRLKPRQWPFQCPSPSYLAPSPSNLALRMPATRMKEKRVTIDPSFPGSDDEKACSRQLTSNDGNTRTLYEGMDMPRDLVPPGQDGYRTPTIEDYELHHNSSGIAQRNVGFSNDSSHIRLPLTPPHFSNRQSANPSSTSLAHSILDRLQWRERIRHYTWTFFTITMAVSHAPTAS